MNAGRMWQTVLQSLVSILILFGLTRIMGKKQVSQLTTFDYVIGISIGSIAAELALESEYIKGITAMVIFAVFRISLSFFSMKSGIMQEKFWMESRPY